MSVPLTRPSARLALRPTRIAVACWVALTTAVVGVVAAGRRRWTMRWRAPLNAFQITFEGRLTPANH